jgi:hypothetical protein
MMCGCGVCVLYGCDEGMGSEVREGYCGRFGREEMKE